MELKIRCQCGVKYAFDVTPESAAKPVQFVCQYCGVDSSALVTQIIQQQFSTATTSGIAAMPPTAPVEMPKTPVATAAAAAPAAAPAARLRVHVAAHAPPAESAAETATTSAQLCLKHPGQFASEACMICKKPMCPKCMELFGYVCSAYCLGQAERQKIEIPVYAGQKAVVERKYWKKVRLIGAAVMVVVVALLGAYSWYYFVGSRPRLVYSLKLPRADYNSFCKLISNDEVLLRHGNKLSRHDLKNDKEIWSVTLIDKDQVAKAAEESLARQKAEMAAAKVRRSRLKAAGQLDDDEIPQREEKPLSDTEQLSDISKWTERTLVSQIRLYPHGQSIWAVSPAKAVQYNVASGKAELEVPVPDRLERILTADGSILLVSRKEKGGQVLTRIDLVDGAVKTAELTDADSVAKKGTSVASAATTKAIGAVKGQTVALRTKSALTNVLAQPVAVRRPPTRMTEADSEPDMFPSIPGETSERVDVERIGTFMVFAADNVAEMEIKLLQKNFVQYKAIKDKKSSELEKGVTAVNASAAINEVMNDIQAERTGGMRTEDESRYQITVRRLLATGIDEWSGEVIGPAAFFSSRTIDVLVAGKGLYVFDKNNKKIWESKLAYPVDPAMLESGFWWDDPLGKRTPFVERGSILYFFDQGVLTAFELASGNVKWRLTSVGVSAVHFDDRGMLYVSTSSAGAESLKYTQQIDLTKRVQSVVMKVDPQNGKILWKIQHTGSDLYFAGKYLYAVEAVPAGGMRIYRLKPGNGQPLWEHYLNNYAAQRDFHEKTIELLYENELQVLRFL